MDKIVAKGIRENNLDNISIAIPRGKITVFTGVSGSGKSTLAFDTIFAEGQRRYLESLSSYAKQFVEKFKKPDLDYISGLSPSVSVDQKTFMRNPRSTVATITEIYDFIRLGFSKLGTPKCYQCGSEMSSGSVETIVDRLKKENLFNKSIDIFYPISMGKKGEFKKEIEFASRFFTIARVEGKTIDISQIKPLEKQKKHNLEIYIDSINSPKKNLKKLKSSLDIGFLYGEGVVIVEVENKRFIFNSELTCNKCGISYPEISPRLFSFNSPYGCCSQCEGIGQFEFVDENLVVDFDKSINDNSILPFTSLSQYKKQVKQFAKENLIDMKKAFGKLSKKHQNLILYGHESNNVTDYIKNYDKDNKEFLGVINILQSWILKSKTEESFEALSKYISVKKCNSCEGARLRKEALHIFINDKNISEFCSFNISEAMNFVDDVKFTGTKKEIWKKIKPEIRSRLTFLKDVGLSYLNLNRSAPTLSGGEAQRIRLATQLGANLTGVTYVLDEPTIGLHPRDNSRLVDALKSLRDKGNTVLVVEHDEDTIMNADNIIDIGPKAGINGGKIVYTGNLNGIKKSKNSLTGKYLNREKKIVQNIKNFTPNTRKISISNIAKNNLKNISIDLPLGHVICVTGVSGSGKSSLVSQTIFPLLSKHINNPKKKKFSEETIKGVENIDKVINIDQSPIGRTSRSNPVTYTGIFSTIRDIFSSLQISKMKGYGPGRFSFNVKEGSCSSCSGAGFNKIEMSFLPDVSVKCEECQGKRFDEQTLDILYNGKNIAEVLDMTFEEAETFFSGFPILSSKISILNSVGLHYLRLGQSATTLSGGEAQRVKLSKELIKKNTGKTFYILDEPTIGLHYQDVDNLMNVIYKLRDSGSTILIVEHNLDVINCSDYIIDLGPEGGERGGYLQFMGQREDFISSGSGETLDYLKKHIS